MRVEMLEQSRCSVSTNDVTSLSAEAGALDARDERCVKRNLRVRGGV